MSWTVVEFLETNTVEAVPTSWLQNDECCWPLISRNKIMVEIRNNTPPNTCWPKDKIRTFKDGTYDDYLIARTKAKRAEDTSDLNSEAGPKRKITKKVFVSSSSEGSCSEESILPKPPKVSLASKTQNSELEVVSDIERQYRPLRVSLAGKAQNREPKVVSDIERQDRPLRVSLARKAQNSELEVVSDIERQDSDCEPGFKKNIPSTNVLSQGPTKVCCCAELLKKMEIYNADVTRNFRSIKANLLQIREDMQTLLDSRNTKTSIDINIDQQFTLPIKSEDELDVFNQWLKTEENFEAAVVYFKNMGGKDEYDFIRRCMVQIITDTLAMTYAYDGTKEKKKFKDLKLNSAIQTASHLHLQTDKKAYETAIRKYLRRAKERSKKEK